MASSLTVVLVQQRKEFATTINGFLILSHVNVIHSLISTWNNKIWSQRAEGGPSGLDSGPELL